MVGVSRKSLLGVETKDNELKDNYIGTNVKKLEFNDMTNGTQKLITGAVRSGDYSYASSKASWHFSKES